MMASRFTKAFQLIALVLAFSVVQVYVMAGPIRSGNDPGTIATSPASEATADIVVADSESQMLTPQAAAEKMTLRFGSKKTLTGIFSRRDLEARIDSGNTFLKANTSASTTFKTSNARPAAAQTSDPGSDSDDNGKKATWIAVGIIAAVLTIAVIGLRHDRSN